MQIMSDIPNIINDSVTSLVMAIDELADIEAKSIATDREENGGILCYDPKTNEYDLTRIDGTNDSVVNKPSLTIAEILNLCPDDKVMTFWHTHGTMLHSFSDLDRYSSGDLAASGRRVGLCSLGIDQIQCHYAFLSVPQVVNIKWDGRLEDRLKEIANKEYEIDDLICDNHMICRKRYWSDGMLEPVLGQYDQVNLIEGVSGAVDNEGGVIASSYTGLTCYEVESEDTFRSLNCFERKTANEFDG